MIEQNFENSRAIEKGFRNLIGGKMSRLLYSMGGDKEKISKLLKNDSLFSDMALLTMQWAAKEYEFGSGKSYSEATKERVKSVNEMNSLQLRAIPAEDRRGWYERRHNVSFESFPNTRKGQKMKEETDKYQKELLKDLLLKYVETDIDNAEYILENIDDYNIENREQFLVDYKNYLSKIKLFYDNIIGKNIDDVRWEPAGVGLLGSLSATYAAMRDVIPTEQNQRINLEEESWRESKEREKEYVDLEVEKTRLVTNLEVQLEDIKRERVLAIEKETHDIEDNKNKSKWLEEIRNDLKAYILILESGYDKDYVLSIFNSMKMRDKAAENIITSMDDIIEANNEFLKKIKKETAIKIVDIYLDTRIAWAKEAEKKELKIARFDLLKKKHDYSKIVESKIKSQIAKIKAMHQFKARSLVHEQEIARNIMEQAKVINWNGGRIEDRREIGQMFNN